MHEIKASKRKGIKEKLDKILNNRLKQLKEFEELIKPIKENIELNKSVMKGKCSLETYIEHSKITTEYNKKIFYKVVK